MTTLGIEIAEKAYPRPAPQSPLVALADFRLTVPEGEFTCIVGPSGCGKTTLLNLIGGLDAVVDGRILFDGRTSPGRPAIGYVFQAPRLMPWLTVRDNVCLAVIDRADDAGVDALLGEMELGEFKDAYPNRLSGGMQRRVAIARAVAAKPGLLLLDEPFLSLDAPVADRLRGLLLDLWASRRTTVLFVTHDLREALYLADRVIFMSARPGRVVLDFRVDLARPRVPGGEEIELLRLRLLKTHPRLLAGISRPQERDADTET